jgi:arsenate reductase (thioredoxin)
VSGAPRRRKSGAAAGKPAGRPAGPQVLFVCVENAGRSQMAEAFARALGLEASSCGSKPGARVNPLAVEAMREKGIDITGRSPKGFQAVPRAEVVVTMGCGDACPYVPGRRFDWDLPDPRGKGIEEVRAIRDEIERRVRELAAELVPR